MYIQQTDVIGGMQREFVKRFMSSTQKVIFKKGDFLYHEQEPAAHFYILLKGCVKLRMGQEGKNVHLVRHAGEAFGWSSLIGLEVHSASAECVEPAVLLKINRERFNEIVANDPANGLVFFKRLARTLGMHLIERNRQISAAANLTIKG